MINVGIDLELEPVDMANFFPAMQSGRYPIMLMRLGAFDDWTNINNVLQPTGPFNYLGTQRDNIDQLISDFAHGNPAEQAAAAQAMNRYVSEEAWFAPFYLPDNIFLTSDIVSIILPTDNVVPLAYQMSPTGN